MESDKVSWEIHRFLGQVPSEAGLKILPSFVSSLIMARATPARSANTVANIGAPFPVAASPIPQSTVANLRPAKGNPSIRIPDHPITPLNLAAFRFYLCDHPDKKFVSKILHIISHGADIGYSGPKCSRFTPNSLSARDKVDALSKQIETEIELQHSIGPFNQPPFQFFTVNSLGARPKKMEKSALLWTLADPLAAA